MARRVTVILDDDLVKKLRERQAKLIKKSTSSVSFSKVLNETIRKNLKAQRKVVSVLENTHTVFMKLPIQYAKAIRKAIHEIVDSSKDTPKIPSRLV